MYSSNLMCKAYNMKLFPSSSLSEKVSDCALANNSSWCTFNDAMNWNDKIKNLMKQKKIRVKDLTSVLNEKTPSAVGHYLSGRRQPDPAQLLALAKFFGVSLDELMDNIDPLHARVLEVLKAAKDAIESLDREFTQEQEIALYKIALESLGAGVLSTSQIKAIAEAMNKN